MFDYPPTGESHVHRNFPNHHLLHQVPDQGIAASRRAPAADHHRSVDLRPLPGPARGAGDGTDPERWDAGIRQPAGLRLAGWHVLLPQVGLRIGPRAHLDPHHRSQHSQPRCFVLRVDGTGGCVARTHLVRRVQDARRQGDQAERDRLGRPPHRGLPGRSREVRLDRIPRIEEGPVQAHHDRQGPAQYGPHALGLRMDPCGPCDHRGPFARDARMDQGRQPRNQ